MRTFQDKIKQLVNNVFITPEITDGQVKAFFENAVDIIEEQRKPVNDEITCLRCNTVNEFYVEISGPHLKAICNHCNRYIKFIPQNKQPVKEADNMKSDKIINIRVNVEKVNKAWLFKGEKGTYLDLTLLYHEKQDDKGQNGMVVQSVPSSIYKKEVAEKVEKGNMTKGEILGNCIDWATAERNDAESKPGYEGKSTPAAAGKTDEPEDDLPF